MTESEIQVAAVHTVEPSDAAGHTLTMPSEPMAGRYVMTAYMGPSFRYISVGGVWLEMTGPVIATGSDVWVDQAALEAHQ